MNSRKPCLCSRLERRYQQALPSDSPREAHLNTNRLLEVGCYAPGTKRSSQQASNTPTQPRRRDTLPKPLDSCLSQCNLTPDTRARAASPPKTRLDPLSGGSLTFLARPREFARFLLCSGAQLTPGVWGRLCGKRTLRHDFGTTQSHRRTNAPAAQTGPAAHRVVTRSSQYPFASGHTRLNTPDPI